MTLQLRRLHFFSPAVRALACLAVSLLAAAATAAVLKSPDGRIELKVELSSKIYYSVNFGPVALLKPSPLTLELGDGTILGANPVLKDSQPREQRGEIRLPWGKNKVLADAYNEIELRFVGDFSVVFRA